MDPQVVDNPNPTNEITLQPEDPRATFVQEVKAAVERLGQSTGEKAAA